MELRGREEGRDKKRKEGRRREKEEGRKEGRKEERKEVNKTKGCLRDQKWSKIFFQIPLMMIKSLALPHAV